MSFKPIGQDLSPDDKTPSSAPGLQINAEKSADKLITRTADFLIMVSIYITIIHINWSNNGCIRNIFYAPLL